MHVNIDATAWPGWRWRHEHTSCDESELAFSDKPSKKYELTDTRNIFKSFKNKVKKNWEVAFACPRIAIKIVGQDVSPTHQLLRATVAPMAQGALLEEAHVGRIPHTVVTVPKNSLVVRINPLLCLANLDNAWFQALVNVIHANPSCNH